MRPGRKEWKNEKVSGKRERRAFIEGQVFFPWRRLV